MGTVINAVAIYFILLIVFRISGKRSLSQITTFDFILLLIIGEAIQQALLGNDFSLTKAFLVVITLIGMDIGVALLKQRFPTIEKLVDSTPLVLVEDGKILQDRMDKARVDVSDILAQGREQQGIERMDQVKYAVLERSGGITVIPKTK